MSFPFENLDVYKKSLVLIDQVDQFCQQNKGKLAFSFQDQLQRAVLSVALRSSKP